LRVSENAREHLVKKGYLANVTFNINIKEEIRFSKGQQFLMVPFTTDYGDFKMYINVMKTEVIEHAGPAH
ncbi:MAG TPA: hypothetical protein PLQ76_09125, partial [bacterium]|nr:hypothetical protein [bacterium]